MKPCRKCKLEKKLDDFVRNKAFKSGIDTICRECSREQVKLWRKLNPQKRKLQLQRESKKDYNHNKHLKHTYGITRDQYLVMFEEQKGCCAICNKHQLEFKKRLFVDHNHSTGEIRKLLCQACNMLIGACKENKENLAKAILYLEEHNG